jgi:hypothetical protein
MESYEVNALVKFEIVVENLEEILAVYQKFGQVNHHVINLYRIVKNINILTVPSVDCASFWSIEQTAVDTKASIMEDIYRIPMTPKAKDNMITLACNILTDFINFKLALRKFIEEHSKVD